MPCGQSCMASAIFGVYTLDFLPFSFIDEHRIFWMMTDEIMDFEEEIHFKTTARLWRIG